MLGALPSLNSPVDEPADELRPLHLFAAAHDTAMKCLQDAFQQVGLSREEAQRNALATITTLLDNGGPGWLDRLLTAHEAIGARTTAVLASADRAGFSIAEPNRETAILAWIAEQDGSIEDIVAKLRADAEGRDAK